MLDLTNLWDYLPIFVGVVLPAIVALVTKELASSKFKSVALLALSALSSVLVPLVGSETYDLQAIFNNFLVIFGSGVLAYYGILKPQGVTETIQSKIPGGLGSEEQEESYGDVPPPGAEDAPVEDVVLEEG